MDDQGNLRRLMARSEEDERILETARLSKLLGRSDLVQPDGSPVPETWTLFQAGERVVVKGRTFSVAWVGEGGILIEPIKVAIDGD